jgi:hypothetical protein
MVINDEARGGSRDMGQYCDGVEIFRACLQVF